PYMRYQFVDCRWELGNPACGRGLYLAGHIPGASFLDVEQDLSAPPGPGGRHPLPDPEQFAAAAGRAGLGDGTFVVAYGSMGGAERLWWLLRHFGHDDCAVLDLDAWHGFFFFEQKTAYEITTGDWSSDVCSSDLVPLRVEEYRLIPGSGGRGRFPGGDGV